MRYIMILMMAMSASLMAETVEIDLSKVTLPSRSEKAKATLAEELTEAAKEYHEAVEKAKADALEDYDKDLNNWRTIHLERLAIEAEIERVKAIDAVTYIASLNDDIDIFGNNIKDLTPIKSHVVDSTSEEGVSFAVPKGRSLIITVNEEDVWSANGSKDRESNYIGLSELSQLNGCNKMALVIVSGETFLPVTNRMVISEGQYIVKCNDDTYSNNSGSIGFSLNID